MAEHASEENESGLRLAKSEIGPDESGIEESVEPFRSDEKVAIGG